MAKIRNEESQQEHRIINGDLIVTGNIINSGFSLLRVLVEKLRLGIGMRDPVAGEPSLGTPHPINGFTNYNIYNNYNPPTTPTLNLIDFPTLVPTLPVGAKSIFLFMRAQSTIVETAFGSMGITGTTWEWYQTTPVVNLPISITGWMRLNADRKGYLNFDNAAISGVYCTASQYTI